MKKGDRIIIDENSDRRNTMNKKLIGEVFGIYDRFFVIESEKGYRESFLKCDIDIGRLDVKVIRKGVEVSILKQM